MKKEFVANSSVIVLVIIIAPIIFAVFALFFLRNQDLSVIFLLIFGETVFLEIIGFWLKSIKIQIHEGFLLYSSCFGKWKTAISDINEIQAVGRKNRSLKIIYKDRKIYRYITDTIDENDFVNSLRSLNPKIIDSRFKAPRQFW